MTTVEVTKVQPAFMSVKGAAEYLGLSTRRIYELISAGDLGPDIHEGRKRLVDFGAVKKYEKRLREA